MGEYEVEYSKQWVRCSAVSGGGGGSGHGGGWVQSRRVGGSWVRVEK